MITKKDYASYIAGKDRIESTAKAVLEMIKELGLTPTSNVDQLKEEYKTLLFSKLVAVDKGIKLQYEIHKTERAKLDLINRTVSLDGYEEIAELEALLKAYIMATNAHGYKQVGIEPESFLTQYNGSIEAFFTGKVIDVTETQLYKELKAVADTLNSLYERGIINEYCWTNGGYYRYLNDFLPNRSFEKKIDIDESTIYYHLKHKESKK